MKLRTKLKLDKKEDEFLIDYHSKILFLGSCFAENIGEKLNYFKFKNKINPFGILFHPKAIETFLERVITKNYYSENELIKHNDLFHCFDAHSKLSSLNSDEVITNLNSSIDESFLFLKEATHLCITLGTSWIYKYNYQQKIVANCHKIPQKEFIKSLLTTNEIEESLASISKLIHSINNDVKIIFTISPVRHLKDGFVENNRSKSNLISALHNFLENSKSDNYHYFPAYEIMQDELRDYRFFADDLVHPSKLAIDYIWSVFSETWIKEDALNTMKKVDDIQKGLAHKPFNKDSEQHQKFLKKLYLKIDDLKKKYNFIRF